MREWCNDTVIVMMRSTIISEWMLWSSYCSGARDIRALANPNYSMNVQSIFIYLFSSEFIYFNITFTAPRWRFLIEIFARVCHKKIINVSSHVRRREYYSSNPAANVAEFRIRENAIALCRWCGCWRGLRFSPGGSSPLCRALSRC